MISLARKELLREQAARARALKLSVGSLARTGQIERSSVDIGDETINIGAAVASVPEMADLVLDHAEDLAVLDPIYDLTDQAQSLEDATHDASMIGIENSVAVEEAMDAAEKAIADAAAVSEFAEGVSATAEAIRVEADAAKNAANLAQRGAAEAAQAAIDRAADAEKAAKEFAEAQAEQAKSDANDETARAVAEARTAAAADAKSKADAAELAAKSKAAEAQSAADAAALAASFADAKATQAREDALRNARYRLGPDAVYTPPMPEGGFRLGAQLVRVDEDGRPFQVDRWSGSGWVRDQILADQILVAGEDGTVRIADGKVTAQALVAGAIDGQTITGATLQTAYEKRRLQFDANGLRSFNEDGNVTANLSADSGGITLTGSLTSISNWSEPHTVLDRGSLVVRGNGSGTGHETLLKTDRISHSRGGYFVLEHLPYVAGRQALTLASGQNANRGYIDVFSGSVGTDRSVYLGTDLITSSRSPKTLFSGVLYMNSAQTANLSELISAQLSGIVLAWSAYADGAAVNSSWNYVFVPKNHVENVAGAGVLQTIYGWKSPVWKYVYIYNNRITGHGDNATAPANTQVLRAVYGV